MLIHEIISPKITNKIFGKIVSFLEMFVAICSEFGFRGRGGGVCVSR